MQRACSGARSARTTHAVARCVSGGACVSVCVCEGVRVGGRVGGLRSVTPSPHATGAQRLTQYKKTNKTNKTRVKSKKTESPSEKTEAVSKNQARLPQGTLPAQIDFHLHGTASQARSASSSSAAAAQQQQRWRTPCELSCTPATPSALERSIATVP